MAILSIKVPSTMADELNDIDWDSFGHINKSDWLRKLIERELPKLKTKKEMRLNESIGKME